MIEIGTANDYRDLLAKLNTFLTTNGAGFNLRYTGTGNGTLTAYRNLSPNVETITLTATSSTNFTVSGSSSGSMAAATVGTPYNNGAIAFTITAGGVAFVAGDQFKFDITTAWGAQRAIPGAILSLSAGSGAGGSSGQFSYENVVDGKLAAEGSRYWSCGTLPKMLEFQFNSALTLVEYAIMGHVTAGNGPTAWTFEYWTGSAWTVLDTRSSIALGAGELRAFTISSPVSASRYRINITAGNATCNIAAIQLRTSTGGIDQAASQYVWLGAGNDGLAQIFIGARSFYRSDVSYWDWELFGFTGYSSAQPLFAQPGITSGVYMALQNSSIPYWFVCDGRRVVVVAKISGAQYESAYLGFLEPYFTPAQFPYPLVIGGSLAPGASGTSWADTNFQSSNATNKHRSPVHSDANGVDTLAYATLKARRQDGTWAPFFATNNDGQNSSEAAGWIWPFFGGASNMDVCVDGSYALLPVMLVDSIPNTLGQLAGLSFLTGQALTAETLVQVGALSHLAVPNINRTDRNDFFAVRLD